MSKRFNRLTRALVRALPPGAKITEHGIQAERLPNGDVRYSINVMVDGRRIHRVVGRDREGATRAQAEQVVEALRTAAREDRLNLPIRRKTHRSFAEAAAKYLAQIEGHPKHGRNLKRKTAHMENRLVPHFSDQRLNRLSGISIAGYVKRRRTDGAAAATINRELATLSHFLNRCVEWEWTPKRIVVDKGEEQRKKIVVLSTADQQALMQAAIADQDPHTWLFTAIAMGTGMRHSEILRIRWEHIDTENKRIHLPTAKAGSREQPMPFTLSERLKGERTERFVSEGWLFPASRGDAKYPHRQTMAHQFRRAVERAKLDSTKVTPHVLRHTAITGLVKAGVDLPTIQRISGHKTLAMVLRYTQLTDPHIDASVAKLDQAFADTFTPKLHRARNTARPVSSNDRGKS